LPFSHVSVLVTRLSTGSMKQKECGSGWAAATSLARVSSCSSRRAIVRVSGAPLPQQTSRPAALQVGTHPFHFFRRRGNGLGRLVGFDQEHARKPLFRLFVGFTDLNASIQPLEMAVDLPARGGGREPECATRQLTKRARLDGEAERFTLKGRGTRRLGRFGQRCARC